VSSVDVPSLKPRGLAHRSPNEYSPHIVDAELVSKITETSQAIISNKPHPHSNNR